MSYPLPVPPSVAILQVWRSFPLLSHVSNDFTPSLFSPHILPFNTSRSSLDGLHSATKRVLPSIVLLEGHFCGSTPSPIRLLGTSFFLAGLGPSPKIAVSIFSRSPSCHAYMFSSPSLRSTPRISSSALSSSTFRLGACYSHMSTVAFIFVMYLLQRLARNTGKKKNIHTHQPNSFRVRGSSLQAYSTTTVMPLNGGLPDQMSQYIVPQIGPPFTGRTVIPNN